MKEPRVFKLLLDCSDTNFDMENKDGNTPLQLAVSCNNAANVNLILASLAKENVLKTVLAAQGEQSFGSDLRNIVTKLQWQN